MDEINIGDAVAIHCGHCTPPKEKYFVVACIEPIVTLLYINSELNDYTQRNEHLLCCNVIIEKESHNFLKRDSYVNCCEPCEEYTLEDIERDFMYGGRLLGVLNNEAITVVSKGVGDSPVMKRKVKKRVLEALSQHNCS